MPEPVAASPASPRQVLREVFGYGAFRGPQQEIVEHVVAGGSALVLMPTGGANRFATRSRPFAERERRW
jgi:Superfamily II DNA helicase